MSDLYRCAYRSTALGGVQFVNTFCVKTQQAAVGPGTPGTGDVADAVHAWLTPTYRAVLATDYTVQELTVRRLTGSPEEDSVGISAAGTLTGGSGAPLPREVGVLLALRTSLATRRGRGRMWLPGPLLAGYLASEHAWSTGSTLWANIGAFITELLAGEDFMSGPGGLDNYHASLEVFSRLDNAGRDVVSIVPRVVPHWLSSRSTAP